MPAPEATQMKVTTAYMYDPKVATADLNASLHARAADGLADCSTGPERKIFDCLWRGQKMSDSDPETRGFAQTWGLVSSTHPGWKDLLHVDHWVDAQHVQRMGLLAEAELIAMSKADESRCIWPIAVNALDIPNVGSSNAVKAVNSAYPWSGAGLLSELGMSDTIGPGEDKSALVAAAQDPGKMFPEKGTQSSAVLTTAKDAETSSMPPPSALSSALPKANQTVGASSSGKVSDDTVPTAKGPPAPKIGGTVSAKGPPPKPSSDSAVLTKASGQSPAAKSEFPTLAESMGRSAPLKKPPPQHEGSLLLLNQHFYFPKRASLRRQLQLRSAQLHRHQHRLRPALPPQRRPRRVELCPLEERGIRCSQSNIRHLPLQRSTRAVWHRLTTSIQTIP